MVSLRNVLSTYFPGQQEEGGLHHGDLHPEQQHNPRLHRVSHRHRRPEGHGLPHQEDSFSSSSCASDSFGSDSFRHGRSERGDTLEGRGAGAEGLERGPGELADSAAEERVRRSGGGVEEGSERGQQRQPGQEQERIHQQHLHQPHRQPSGIQVNKFSKKNKFHFLLQQIHGTAFQAFIQLKREYYRDWKRSLSTNYKTLTHCNSSG